MAGGTLKSAVSRRKTIQRQSGGRRVGLGGEGAISGDANGPIRVGESGGVTNLAADAGGRSAVATLAVGLHEPADAIGCSDLAHVSVTALALHFKGAVAGNGAAHGAAQTF